MAGDEERNRITEVILACAFEVSNTLGTGFLEKVYENALSLELRSKGLKVEQQKGMKVLYKDEMVGEYYADLLVADEIIVEMKAIRGIDDSHIAQLMNYLKACKKRIGLILNFGKSKVEIKRVVCGF